MKKLILIGEVVLPFVLSGICQRLSIGRGYDFNINVLFLNYVIWGAVLLFFVSIFKKNYLSLIFYFLFFFFFTIVDRYRVKFLNEPLRFNDINLIGQFPGIMPFLVRYPNLKKELILGLVALVITFFLIKKIVKIELKNIKIRVIFLVISLLILASPYLNKKIFDKILEANNIVFNSWYRLENCQNNGMILCFIYDLQFIKHEEPKDYNQAEIKKIFEKIPNTITVKKPQIKPNIIVILSESLWEATRMPKIKFYPDPLVNIKKDIKGSIVSPSFGGGTANVEFEFLTGLSNFLFQDNSYPYTDLIRKKMPSLFTVFKDNGYLTTAIHPYSQQFYNRKNVYKYFGLDEFISLDQMFNFETAGPFVSDKFFTNEILKRFNSTDQPQFIFALSMQNHDLYEPNRFGKEEIKITGELEKSDKDVLQSYIEGINLTDKSYLYLKNELKKIKKPTIVIMFGDHLPFLNDNYSVYKKGGFFSEGIKMSSTPLTLWSNYGVNFKQEKTMGMPVLATRVLDWANVEPEYQFKFVKELAKKFPYLVKKINTEVDKDLIRDYNLVQYDLLFGSQYLKDIVK